MKETENSALITVQAFHYQNIIALEKCFEMQEGDSIYIENDGDVSHQTRNSGMGEQIEVKDVKAPLTDHQESFWKTLKNWLSTGFNHAQYKNLILHTTQSFGKTTKLIDWNNKDPQEKLQLLKDIYSNNFSSQSKISEIQKTVLDTDEQVLLKVIEKFVIYTDSDDKGKILEKIKKEELKGIPENNQQVFIENLIGFLYELGCKERWLISYNVFKKKLEDLTSRFCRKVFTFPEFQGLEATAQEVAENETRTFVTKIKDIHHDEVIPEAIGNWLEFTQSLVQDLDNSPIYREKTNKYKSQLISLYKRQHSKACRNSKNPCDLYDEVIGEKPLAMDNYTPHVAYRNGVLHEAMDSDKDLKWDTKK